MSMQNVTSLVVVKYVLDENPVFHMAGFSDILIIHIDNMQILGKHIREYIFGD